MRKHHTAKRHAGGVLVTVGREPAEVLLDLAEAEALLRDLRRAVIGAKWDAWLARRGRHDLIKGAPNHPNPPGSGTSSTG